MSPEPNTFAGCSNLRTIYCKGETPFKFYYQRGYEAWFEDMFSEITLYVPIGSKSIYENQKPWSFCKVIEEMEFPDIEYSEIESAIADNDISISVENGNILINNADNSKISISNTNGQCVYNGYATSIPMLSKGVHIVKINNKTFKLVL